jgi:type IV pilus assembly protein PilO
VKLRFSKGNKLSLILVFLIIVFGSISTQFFIINPLKSDLKIKSKTLETEQNLLNSIGNNEIENSKDRKVNTKELQKKLPVNPLQDQFILDLEQAETVSNSQIKSMDFSNQEQQETQNDQINNLVGNTVQQNSETTNEIEKQNSNNNLPSGVKKLTVKLTIESSGYEEFEQFIDSLEKLKRIIVVEAIEYSDGKEQISLDKMDKPFSYNLTVSTFYMPELKDLKGQGPKTMTPNPAKKQNPLSQFPDVLTP